MDLEVAGADRRLDAVAVAAHVRERLRHGRLGRAEEAEHARPRRGARQHTPHGRRLQSARPQPAQLAGRAGHHDDDAPVRVDDEARRGSGGPEHVAPSGSRRLLAHALREVRVRPSAGGRRGRARSPRSPLELASTTSGRPATFATSSTVRSSWVGPRPPETRQRSASHAATQRALELVRAVADDGDARRLETELSASARRTGRSGR